MMRVLVLGGGGMLGHKVWQEWSGRFDLRVMLRDRKPYAHLPFFDPAKVIDGIDATRPEAIADLIAQFRPDAVVNCIGIVKQRAEAHDPIVSIRINSLFPHLVARACAAAGTRMIQISTDCVFSGQTGGYRETDNPDPVDLYGRSKLLGEVDAPALTVRTSIVGRELEHAYGLVEWFLSERGKRLRGFTRARFSGVTTRELARLLGEIIERHPKLSGLYHVASEPISKYDLLLLFNDVFSAGATIEPDESVAIDRVLDGSRFSSETGIAVTPWPEMARQLAGEAAVYEEWRRR